MKKLIKQKIIKEKMRKIVEIKKKKIENLEIKNGIINIININKSDNKKKKDKKSKKSDNKKNKKNKENLNHPPHKKDKKLKNKLEHMKIKEKKKDSKNSTRLQIFKNNTLENKEKEQNNNISTLNISNYIKTKKILKNNSNKKKNIFKYLNDYELNTLEYQQAIKIDKRTYIQFYFSLLRRKQVIIFTFYIYNDYNLKIIKISLFIFSFASYYSVNAIFFTDYTMHKIYEDQGNFNFIYQLPQIIYSSLICSVINIIVVYFSLSEKNILSLKNEKKNINQKIAEKSKCLRIKFYLFFLISFLLLILFWYYLSCFCSVYKNSQLHLFKDTIICFGLSLLYPLGLCLLPGIFRIPSLKAKQKDKEYLYKFSKIIQFI